MSLSQHSDARSAFSPFTASVFSKSQSIAHIHCVTVPSESSATVFYPGLRRSIWPGHVREEPDNGFRQHCTPPGPIPYRDSGRHRPQAQLVASVPSFPAVAACSRISQRAVPSLPRRAFCICPAQDQPVPSFLPQPPRHTTPVACPASVDTA